MAMRSLPPPRTFSSKGNGMTTKSPRPRLNDAVTDAVLTFDNGGRKDLREMLGSLRDAINRHVGPPEDDLSSLMQQAIDKTIASGPPPITQLELGVDFKLPDGRLLMGPSQAGNRCFIDCPAAGYRREVLAVEYRDGGRLVFPHDFSSDVGDEKTKQALPKGDR
jgi:hypothetical protein